MVRIRETEVWCSLAAVCLATFLLPWAKETTDACHLLATTEDFFFFKYVKVVCMWLKLKLSMQWTVVRKCKWTELKQIDVLENIKRIMTIIISKIAFVFRQFYCWIFFNFQKADKHHTIKLLQSIIKDSLPSSSFWEGGIIWMFKFEKI